MRPSMARRAKRPPARLRPLARLLGTWKLRGRTAGSPSDNIRGTVRCVWSADRTFLESRSVIRVEHVAVHALEVLTYGGTPGTYRGWVFSGDAAGP
ncbi:MAG TPA: hypothetical protein VMC82_03875, partial [Thermoplasmata archaeon]|nr:hypothetical protein [Thermoplasmata archaeon]